MTLGTKFVVKFLVARQVTGRARGREGTGQGEQGDPLAFENFVAGQVFPLERVGTFDGVLADPGLEGNVRDCRHFHFGLP